MTRTRQPKYRRHKASGQAVVTLDGRDFYLGKWRSAESKAEYSRLLAEWNANGRQLSIRGAMASELTASELILAYYRWAEGYYRDPDGKPTSEAANIKAALRPVRKLYGHTLAADFDSLALEAVRGDMIQSGRCRNMINKDTCRIKRMFRWAAAKRMVPVSVPQLLGTVEGLRAGRSDARESAPVQPVSRDIVEQTQVVMTPTLADMVSLQLETGMRPGEICAMRAIDIDMTGNVWLYRPRRHKTMHHGHTRIVPIGPKGQEIVRRHLKANVEAFLFTPADSIMEHRAEKRRSRKSKVQPSQQDRSKRKPKRTPRQWFTTSSYANAIAHACERAFPLSDALAPGVKPDGKRERKQEWKARLTPEEKAEIAAWRQEHRWHPHRLRHTRALELKREAGLDAARAVLGHRSPIITEHYATLDIAKGIELMAKIG
jgi:integrase